MQSEHADPVFRYYAQTDPALREYHPVKVTSSVAQAAMIGNPVSFPRVKLLAERYIDKGGEFAVVEVTEQAIMDAMLEANRHGHIACTQGGECLAGLLRARELGLLGPKDFAVLDATAHALKFADFQTMYFSNSFPPEYEVTPRRELANHPELVISEAERRGAGEGGFARAAAVAVAKRLDLKSLH